MNTSSNWQAPFDLFNQLDKDSAKLLFDLAEKRLKNILETADKTTNRAYIVLTATIPLVAFLFSALFKHYFGATDTHLSGLLLVACWLTILVSLISNAFLLRVAFPRDMHQVGREPKMLFTNELLTDTYYQEDKQAKMLLIYETEDLQQRIDYMQTQSNNRVYWFKTAVFLLFGYAFLCFIILSVLALFR